ncbi:hypothetical protein BGZ47_003404 [Haplosporangium gracile]|nr:hypothetical protein BGZ47_003404 [Haplosporangium gracile]
MSNISEKVSNTASSYIGGAKQTIGETIGNNNLAASGAQQKSQANAATKAAPATVYTKGLGHKATDEVQENNESMTGKDGLSNTANSYMGGAKQTIGETIGNNNLAASGAQQKAQADAAQKAADARTHAEGVGNKVKGSMQQNVGSMTGNTSMEARGHANETRGDMKRNV